MNCDKNPKLTDDDLLKLYSSHKEFEGVCSVFWDFGKAAINPSNLSIFLRTSGAFFAAGSQLEIFRHKPRARL